MVYRAHHVQLDRQVALKVLHPGAGRPEAERFQIEAQAAARLRHPNIVGIHEVGQVAPGRPYLAMDLIEGPSLKDRISDGPLAAPEAARLASKLARAVYYTNDKRANAKKVLNEYLGSTIVEEKSYQDYS